MINGKEIDYMIVDDVYTRPCEYIYTNLMPVLPPTPAAPACAKTKKKGKSPMRYYDEYNDTYVDTLPTSSDEQTKRSYLQQRLDGMRREQRSKLLDAFNLNYPSRPTTVAELIKAIQSGNITVKDEYLDKRTGYPLDYIVWRSPEVKEDREGFEKAEAKMEAAYTNTMDTVKIGDVAEALKAVQKFDQTDFSK